MLWGEWKKNMVDHRWLNGTTIGALGLVAVLLLIVMIVVIFTTGVRLSYEASGPPPPATLDYKFRYEVGPSIVGGYDTGSYGLVVHDEGLWCLKDGLLFESGDFQGQASGGIGNRAWLYNADKSCTYLFTQNGTRWFLSQTLGNTDGAQSGDFCFHNEDNPPFLYAGDVDLPNGHLPRSITGTATGFVLLTELTPAGTSAAGTEYYLWAYGVRAYGGLLLELERYPHWIRATDLGNNLLVLYQEGPNVVTYLYYPETDKWIPSQTLYGTHGKVGPACDTLALVQDNLTTKLYRLDRDTGLYLTGEDARMYPSNDVQIISNRFMLTSHLVYQTDDS